MPRLLPTCLGREVEKLMWLPGGSRLIRWLRKGGALDIFHGVPATSSWYARLARHFENYLEYGGMPTILDSELCRDERTSWLRDYQRTYLGRVSSVERRSRRPRHADYRLQHRTASARTR